SPAATNASTSSAAAPLAAAAARVSHAAETATSRHSAAVRVRRARRAPRTPALTASVAILRLRDLGERALDRRGERGHRLASEQEVDAAAAPGQEPAVREPDRLLQALGKRRGHERVALLEERDVDEIPLGVRGVELLRLGTARLHHPRSEVDPAVAFHAA